jgi:hypothetical protein
MNDQRIFVLCVDKVAGIGSVSGKRVHAKLTRLTASHSEESMRTFICRCRDNAFCCLKLA